MPPSSFRRPGTSGRGRNPFVASAPVETAAAAAWSGRSQAQALARLRAKLDGMGAQPTVLYKEYADLCEPEGARFLAFGVDPAFGGCVDGLVRLDLARPRPARRSRCVGGMA